MSFDQSIAGNEVRFHGRERAFNSNHPKRAALKGLPLLDNRPGHLYSFVRDKPVAAAPSIA
jgi:hypothetical protein